MHTTPPSLLERLRRPGEDPAWERFVLLYTPFNFSLARRFGLDRDAAADVVQDVFVLLARKMVEFTYDPKQSFRYVTARALEIMQRDFAPTTWKACWELIMTSKSAA